MSALERHGTALMALKPGSVAAAAEFDLRRRGDKHVGDCDRFAPYSFHRTHVRKASGAVNLIDRAIAEPQLGAASGKRITRLFYGEPDLLWAARAHLLGTARRAEDRP